jgi:hypothetical protein
MRVVNIQISVTLAQANKQSAMLIDPRQGTVWHKMVFVNYGIEYAFVTSHGLFAATLVLRDISLTSCNLV